MQSLNKPSFKEENDKYLAIRSEKLQLSRMKIHQCGYPETHKVDYQTISEFGIRIPTCHKTVSPDFDSLVTVETRNTSPRHLASR